MKKNVKTLAATGVAAALLILILWQTGAFRRDLLEPGRTEQQSRETNGKGKITVEETEIPLFYHAVGTIHSRTEAEAAARITARILDVKVRSGDKVKTGDILVELDKTDLAERLKQASERVKETQASLKAAEQEVKQMSAVFDLAKKNFDRDKVLYKKDVIPKKQFDETRSKFETAMAMLNRANERETSAQAAIEAARAAVKEQSARLGYATITAPFDGIVARQLADPGDLASPGVTLITLFDPTRIMFYVPIREGLVAKVKVGNKIAVDVPAAGEKVDGVIREIVPSVNPASRTFLVKICLPAAKDLMPGMFGSVMLDIGKQKAIIIPENAITNVGQLEYVELHGKNGTVERRLVRSVPFGDSERRVVSGLRPGNAILEHSENPRDDSKRSASGKSE